MTDDERKKLALYMYCMFRYWDKRGDAPLKRSVAVACPKCGKDRIRLAHGKHKGQLYCSPCSTKRALEWSRAHGRLTREERRKQINPEGLSKRELANRANRKYRASLPVEVRRLKAKRDAERAKQNGKIKEQNLKAVENLRRGYIVSNIVRDSGLARNAVPEQLVDACRILILIHREVRSQSVTAL